MEPPFQIVVSGMPWRTLRLRISEAAPPWRIQEFDEHLRLDRESPCYAIEACHNNGECKVLCYQMSPMPAWVGTIPPFHAWLAAQSNPGFWDVALAWDLYRQAVYFGEHFLQSWPDALTRALPREAMLEFLDVSRGYLVWDFQMELAYRLADPNFANGVTFRKDWNAGKWSARELAEALRMPDGRTLRAVIDARALDRVRPLVRAIHSRSVAAILRLIHGDPMLAVPI